MKRKIYKLLSRAKQGVFALALTVFSGTTHSQTTYTFSYTGAAQTINLPAGSYSIAAWGADGGNGNNGTGGKGGYSQGTLTVGAPTNYYVYVGGKGSTASAPTTGGWNGGGSFIGSFTSGYNCGTGGGGTDIRTTANTTYANRIIVAGGGGGGTGYSNYTGNGGNGGGANGQDGSSSRGQTYAGGGATAAAGGTAATGSGIAGYSQPGGLGIGGDYTGTLGGTAGGGGYYGGGSGHWGGSGGGGSAYTGGVTGGLTVPVAQPGFVTNPDPTGNGMVLITALCNVNITSTASLICSGAAVTLSTNAVAGTYTWSTGNTTTTSIVVSPAVTTTYSLSGQGTSPAGCMGSTSFIVTVNNTPTVTINSSTTSACQGQSVTLTASGANTYTWNNSVVNGTSFVPAGGTTTYVVTGGNACGTASAAVTLTISTLPVTAVTSSTLVCSGSPATLTAGGATTYSWAPGASTQTNNVVTPAVTTVYTLTGISGPCSSSAMVTVSTKTLPAISIVSASTSLCYGNSLNLNASGDATTYSWSTGQTGTSITVSPTITSVYSLTGTNVVNCTKTISQIYVVNPNPVASISVSDPEVCSGGSSTLTASGAATFNWVGGPATATRVVNPASNQTYTVSVINPTTSCHTETTITVTVFVPVLPVSGNTTVCTGSNVTIGASGAISYTWTNDPSNSQSIVVNPVVNTTYMVTGSVVNPINGITCPATNTIEVDVFTPPTITATGNYTAICRGISASLTAAGAGATGTYTWAAGLGNNPVVSVAPILNQLYSVSGTDGNGCKGTATVQVLVDGCTGITTIAANSINLSVYPNPASGEFTIASDQSLTLYIVNELGQQVKEITLNSTTPQVKVNNLANGVYFITGRNINGSVKQKIVIAK